MLSEAEVLALVDTPNTRTPLGLRDRAAIELLYATGLGCSELVGLALGAVNLDERYVVCLGKGGRERAVPMGEPAARALAEYLERGRPQLRSRGTGREIFLNHRGNRMSRAGVWDLLRRARPAGPALVGR